MRMGLILTDTAEGETEFDLFIDPVKIDDPSIGSTSGALGVFATVIAILQVKYNSNLGVMLEAELAKMQGEMN